MSTTYMYIKLIVSMPELTLLVYCCTCLFVLNKYMFAYLSLLVQEGHFRVIEVFFLIVGHTHTSIDQYFSVISRMIWMCAFLGSPISLESLLAGEDFEISMSGNSWVNNEEQDGAEAEVKTIACSQNICCLRYENGLDPID